MASLYTSYLGPLISAVSGVKTAVDIGVGLTSGGDKHSEMMDPMTLMVQLVLLSMKEIGTKIVFKDHRIVYQELKDYKNMFIDEKKAQGVARRIQSAGREDLSSVKIPIIRAAQWYHPEKVEEVKNIFLIAKIGLEKLMMTYASEKEETTTITEAISRWVEIIDESSQKGYPDSVEPLKDHQKAIINCMWVNDDLTIVELLIKKIVRIFKRKNTFNLPKEIIINEEEIKNDYYDEYTDTVDALEIIINGKIKKFKSIIEKETKEHTKL